MHFYVYSLLFILLNIFIFADVDFDVQQNFILN